MDTNERPKMLLKEEVYSIVGAAMEVLNELGNEKPYENALVIEFQIRNIPYLQQPNYQMVYKGHPVGLFIPDLIAFNGVVVDTKVIDPITDVERGQVINYLKITKLRGAVILNFKHPKLEWERVVL
jgi:GxxExxY protein